MNEETKRYRVVSPKSGGYSFWNVYDIETNMTLVSIFETVPNAEYVCLKIVESLTK